MVHFFSVCVFLGLQQIHFELITSNHCQLGASSNKMMSEETFDAMTSSFKAESQASSSVTCSPCTKEMIESETYRCTQCLEVATEDVFCENCILIHVRKGHSVIDCRGYTPKVCDKHKNLCRMYCNDCKTVFCFECIGPHCKHGFIPVSEKACEVRKEIFEYLGEFEKLAKPMSVQESQVRSVLSHHQALYPGLTLDTLVDFLCEKFSASLRNDGQNLVNIVEKKSVACSETEANQNVFVVSQKSGDQIASLRKMLSMSDGVCVSTFVESTSQLNSSIEEQKKELNVFTVRSWTNSLDNIIKSSVTSALAVWEFPNVVRQNILFVDVVKALQPSSYCRSTPFETHWRNEFCVDIHLADIYRHTRQSFDVRRSATTETKTKMPLINTTLNFVSSAESLQFHCIEGFSNRKKHGSQIWQMKKYLVPISGEGSSVFTYGNDVAISIKFGKHYEVTFTRQSNSVVSNYTGWSNLNAHYFPQMNQFSNKLLLKKGDKPLFFLRDLESSQYWVVIAWNSSDLSLTFYYENQKIDKYPCKSKPCSITAFENVLVYAESSGSLTFVHLMSRIYIEVSSQEHGMNCIDNICFDSFDADRKGQVVLFNYKDRL